MGIGSFEPAVQRSARGRIVGVPSYPRAVDALPETRVVRDGREPRARSGDPAVPALVLAPRALPMRLTWRLLFGSPVALFGWVFAAFGMVFTLLFLPLAAWPFDGHDAEAVATVTHVDATSASENKQRIYRVEYTFTRDGTELRGSSYTSEPPHVGGHTARFGPTVTAPGAA